MISPDLKIFLTEHENDNLEHLALQAAKFPHINVPFALQQLKGKRIAMIKIPTWAACEELLYPKTLSMEQCSSETTAQFKASLAKGDTLVDLTGGFGVDFYFMAKHFQKAIYVEKQPELEEIAKTNFKTLELHQAQTFCDDSVVFLQNMNFKADTIFIDPARRSDSGQKTVLLQDCTPDLTQIDNLLSEKSRQTIIKLSPMLDISASVGLLKNISDVFVIAVQNEVKELLLRKTEFSDNLIIHALNFQKNDTVDTFSFSPEEESTAQVAYASSVQKYLFEPNASILKAAAYKLVAERFSFQKLHPNSHLYTSNTFVAEFPGRILEVMDSFSFSSSELKRLHQTTSKANVSIRNFPSTVNDLRKKLKLTDGGDYYLFATTLADNQKRLILTKKVS